MTCTRQPSTFLGAFSGSGWCLRLLLVLGRGALLGKTSLEILKITWAGMRDCNLEETKNRNCVLTWTPCQGAGVREMDWLGWKSTRGVQPPHLPERLAVRHHAS